MCASNVKRITFVATTHLPYSESEWKRVQLCVCGKKATKQKNKLKLYFIVGVSNCLKPVELYTFNIVLYMACVYTTLSPSPMPLILFPTLPHALTFVHLLAFPRCTHAHRETEKAYCENVIYDYYTFPLFIIVNKISVRDTAHI